MTVLRFLCQRDTAQSVLLDDRGDLGTLCETAGTVESNAENSRS